MQEPREERGLAWVLSDGHTASTDYFLFPWLERQGYLTELADTRRSPAEANNTKMPALVVVSRYLPGRWFALLKRMSKQGVEIVYFMDDDLFDWRVLSDLPWRYRWKIVRLALLQYNKLRRLCSQFLVSTPYLAEKYANLNPSTLDSLPVVYSGTPHAVRICYHGTASHSGEIIWLKEVMSGVQSRATNTHFEIFGDAEVRQQFRNIPRVSVMHAMSWPDYLSWSTIEQRDIALAPLLAGDFNAARGTTKFFDYTRLGAVGLYSNVMPYQSYIKDGVDGLLVDNEPEQWIEAIMMMVSDPERRSKIASAAMARVATLGSRR